MNRLSILLISLLAILGVSAQNGVPGQWKLHNAWGWYGGNVTDTPNRTYIIMPGQYYNSYLSGWGEDSKMLFVYDKETGEMQGYNAANYLHGNIVTNMAYNAQKGYLLIVYHDSKIDLLFDDDTVLAVPGLSTATVNSAKNVNNITFDPENSRAYLATDFGYIVIDDKKAVIAESHVYNKKLNGVARVGDRLLASTDEGVFTSPLSDRHSTWAAFTKLPEITDAVSGIIPLSSDRFAYVQSGLGKAVFAEDGTLTVTKYFTDGVQGWDMNKQGYYVDCGWFHQQLKPDGSITRYVKPEELKNRYSGSWDFSNFYTERGPSGFTCRKYDGSDWTVTTQFNPPVANVYKAFHFDYSPEYGMIIGSSSLNAIMSTTWVAYSLFSDMYKDDTWTHFGRLGPSGTAMRNAYGPVVDPVVPETFWVGSFSGLYAVKMPEQTATLYASSGENAVFPDIFDGSVHKTQVSLPTFDADGNLWCFQNIKGSTDNNYSPLWVWPKEGRLAGDKTSFKSIPLKGYVAFGAAGIVQPLKAQVNRNIVLAVHPTEWEGALYFLDHNGTLDNAADDKAVAMQTFTDQNGSNMQIININCFWEDETTGEVWVGTSTGLFTIKPADILAGNQRIRRIIVARNDGTNQGDYLLDGVDITAIHTDGAGRKWVATNGSGVFVVAADGSEVIQQFTADNSLLPSNIVYNIGFDPTSNAVWIGSQYQLATYYTDVTPGEADYSNVVSYPNPVRPEYYGQVTIQGLMDDSLVKIIDQGGNLVKELGRSQGGMITWDMTNVNGVRVSTGVYIIAASTEGGATANAGKILVVK